MEQRLIQFIRQEQQTMEQRLHLRIAARYVPFGLLSSCFSSLMALTSTQRGQHDSPGG
jgi:hypothetical protein